VVKKLSKTIGYYKMFYVELTLLISSAIGDLRNTT